MVWKMGSLFAVLVFTGAATVMAASAGLTDYGQTNYSSYVYPPTPGDLSRAADGADPEPEQ